MRVETQLAASLFYWRGTLGTRFLLVAQRLRRQNPRSRPRRIDCRYKRNANRNQRHDHSIDHPRYERDIVDRIYLWRKRNKVIVSARPRDRISQYQSGGGSDQADQDSLRNEHAANLFFL